MKKSTLAILEENRRERERRLALTRANIEAGGSALMMNPVRLTKTE